LQAIDEAFIHGGPLNIERVCSTSVAKRVLAAGRK